MTGCRFWVVGCGTGFFRQVVHIYCVAMPVSSRSCRPFSRVNRGISSAEKTTPLQVSGIAECGSPLNWPRKIPLGLSTRRISFMYSRTTRSEEHTSELQSHLNLVCRLLLEKKKNIHR